MARLRYIQLTQHRSAVVGGKVEWRPLINHIGQPRVPVLVWENGEPWREANLWAMHRVMEREVHADTVRANMNSLLMYARWLEETGTSWWEFPAKKADRCLVQFRGFVIKMRDADTIAPSTASQRMRDVINFYRWLQASSFLKSSWPLWQERTINIRFVSNVGFERTMSVKTTDLHIPNRSSVGEKLESGLLPVSAADRDQIIRFVHGNGSWELYLLLTLGFYTGMRIGTLCDLKIDTIRNATPEPLTPNMYRIAVGPGAQPKVKTKFGVTGNPWITREHRDLLLRYIVSPRRETRVKKATADSKDLVFLTKNGNPYVSGCSERSSAINVEIFSMRRKAATQGLKIFQGFYFHRSRATFATQLTSILLPIAGVAPTLGVVMEAMLHKDEMTTLKYIKFVQRSPMKEAMANEFTKAFMGAFKATDQTDEG
ncbi:site-specific integrase [Pseudomonas canadensis]|uniref:site-specific integrase n=1 Tax=Pseudomonas canadensis TaxID=915099 RepID=UPI0027337E92|nr:site-specific integrase [Pseudomonas canadensis]WLH29934.1 site-specific integrase [Pseudomonas canadensis]